MIKSWSKGLCDCQLSSIQPCLFYSLSIFLSSSALFANYGVTISQGHRISALDIECLLHFSNKKGQQRFSSYLAFFYSLKAQSTRPLQLFLPPSRTCYLTSWWSRRTSTLWRTSRWHWPAAPPRPLRSTSNATASGFTRTTTWLSGLLTQPQVREKLVFSH